MPWACTALVVRKENRNAKKYLKSDATAVGLIINIGKNTTKATVVNSSGYNEARTLFLRHANFRWQARICSRDGSIEKENGKAVSYTHLDVYKRQVDT